MDFSTLLSLYLTILLPLSLIFLLYSSRRNRRYPPGNFSLPFVGETLQLISAYKSDNPEPFIDARVNRFGPIFTSHVFGEPTVFSVDPETNRFIMQSEGKLFESSYPSSISTLIGKHSLLMMNGSMHKRMHLLTLSFATPSVIRDHLIVDIDRLIRLNLDSWTPGHLFLLQEAEKISFALTVTLRKDFLLVIDGFFSPPFPLFSSTYSKAIKARGKVMEALRPVVRERREENAGGERKHDFLQALLDEETSEGGRFSDEQVADFLVGILAAGFDTTSTAITLIVKFLTETPLALSQLNANGNVIMLSKACVQCYTIPKGWKVFASFRGVHMNDEHFKDARTFNPWRWQHDKGAACQPNVFTPFGGGTRMCPGFEIARVTISLFLHHFVTQFSWEPAGEDRLLFFPTTRTQKGFPIHVKRINKAGM